MASKNDKLVLFDLPSKAPNRCWSANTWKVRLILNYKGIPYETEWLEFPEIEPTLKRLNVPPNSSSRPGLAAYTVPAVLFPDGKAMMDSAAVATELERRYPTPSVSGIPSLSTEIPAPGSPEVESDPALARTAEYAVLHTNASKPFRGIMFPRIIEHIVTDTSRPTEVAKLGGKSLEEFKAGIDTAQVLKDMEPPLRELGAFWGKQAGAFDRDGKLGWAAVQQLSALHSICIGAPDVFRHLMGFEGSENVKKLYDSARENGWFNRDDH